MPGAKPIIAKAEPVTASSGRLFVQAGAFSEKRNAERVRSDLSSIGPADIAPARITGHSLFRVRVGPVRSNAEADRLLSQVVRAGYRSSKIVAD
jgi:rare lipoprotein A